MSNVIMYLSARCWQQLTEITMFKSIITGALFIAGATAVTAGFAFALTMGTSGIIVIAAMLVAGIALV